MDRSDLFYDIALTMIPGVGVLLARKLLDYYTTSKELFSAEECDLINLGLKQKSVDAIVSKSIFSRVEEEILFIDNHNIQALSIADSLYPEKLRECCDAPIVIYQKGNFNLNGVKVLSVVGMRRSTLYGRRFCQLLMSEIASRDYPVVVVSGLAYGIDIEAQRAAMECGVPTVAVVAHGLNRVYPTKHRSDLINMINSGGGVITEFHSHHELFKGNFVRRNRVVAGVADAVLVVESASKGGSLITADLALSYDRDLFAVPGRSIDRCSQGCNNLIKSNSAFMVESFLDIEQSMGWDQLSGELKKGEQGSLFGDDVGCCVEMTPLERTVYGLIERGLSLTLDDMITDLDITIGELTTVVVNMELKGIIRREYGSRFTI